MATHEGSFVRWQSIALTQLGHVINLILGLATASLGFELTLVTENKLLGFWARCLLVISLAGFLASIAIAIWCELNRLVDFRRTTQTARLREENPKDEELENLRKETKKLGKRTWRLFYIQVAAFGVGLLAVIGSFVAAYHGTLL